jgi:hypothetical protein
MKTIKGRLTYANVMSSLAVFLILGGGAAIAAKQKRIGTNKIKAQAITAGKLKNEAVSSQKLRSGAVSAEKLAEGSVTSSKIAREAIGADQIANEAIGGEKIRESTLSEVPSANSANPVLFARVSSNGSVDGAYSKGITSPNVSHPGPGVFCISVPSFIARGAQATTQFGGTGGTTAQVTIGGTGSCPAPGVQVQTWTTGPAAAADVGFYVVLYR